MVYKRRTLGKTYGIECVAIGNKLAKHSNMFSLDTWWEHGIHLGTSKG